MRARCSVRNRVFTRRSFATINGSHETFVLVPLATYEHGSGSRSLACTSGGAEDCAFTRPAYAADPADPSRSRAATSPARVRKTARKCKVPPFCAPALGKPPENAMSLRFAHPSRGKSGCRSLRMGTSLKKPQVEKLAEEHIPRKTLPRAYKTRAPCFFGRFSQRGCTKQRDFAPAWGGERVASRRRHDVQDASSLPSAPKRFGAPCLFTPPPALGRQTGRTGV